jgi:hypothetical protein
MQTPYLLPAQKRSIECRTKQPQPFQNRSELEHQVNQPQGSRRLTLACEN